MRLKHFLSVFLTLLTLSVGQMWGAGSETLGTWNFTNGTTMPTGASQSGGAAFATTRYCFDGANDNIVITPTIPNTATTLYVVVKGLTNGASSKVSTITISGLNSSNNVVSGASGSYTTSYGSATNVSQVDNNTKNEEEISFSATNVAKIKIACTTYGGSKYIVRSVTITYDEGASCSTPPTVGTNLTSVSATTNSITATVPISDIGGCNITENGLVYSTSVATPTVGAANCTKVTATACGGTAANKTITINNLSCGTTYYVRGYAINDGGTSYTNVKTQATSDCLVDHFIDEVQSTTGYTDEGMEKVGDYSASLPTIADKNVATTGNCQALHYHFCGWVTETYKNNPHGHLATINGTATGTTYYAVWAKQGAGSGSASGGITQAEITTAADGKTAGSYGSQTSSSASGNWTGSYAFNTKNNKKVIQITNSGSRNVISPVFGGNITSISVVYTVDASSNRTLTFKDGETSLGTITASANQTEKTSSSLSVTGSHTSFTLTTSAGAVYFHSISVTYNNVVYTDSISVCCTELGSINGSVSLTQLTSGDDKGKLQASWTMASKNGLADNGIKINIYKVGTVDAVHTSSALSKDATSYTWATAPDKCSEYYATLTTIKKDNTFCEGEEQGQSENVTTAGYTITYNLTDDHVTKKSGDTPSSSCDGDVDAIYQAASGFVLPSSISVTNAGDEDENWTWDSSTGELTILADGITGDVEVTITADEDACDPMTNPSVSVEKTYSSATLSWSAISHAAKYKVYIYNNDDSNLESNENVTGTSYTISETLTGLTTYKYRVDAVSENESSYCSSYATGSFTTPDYPTVKLYYSENGTLSEGVDQKILTNFTLPNTAAECNKTFIGWTTLSSYSHASTAPDPFIEKGATWQIPTNAACTLYAVYADVVEGSLSWDLVTDASSLEENDVITLTSTCQYTYSQKTYKDTVAYAGKSGDLGAAVPIGITNNQIREVKSGSIRGIKLENGTASGTWKLYDLTDKYLTEGDKKITYSETSGDVTITITDGVATIKFGTSSYTIQYNPNNNAGTYSAARFAFYSSTQKGIQIYKKNEVEASTTNYSLTCQGKVAKPTITGVTGGQTYEEDQTVTITSATDGATIKYTTDGSDPASSATTMSSGSSFTLSTNGTYAIRAIAVKADMTNSDEATPVSNVTIEKPYTTIKALIDANLAENTSKKIAFNSESNAIITAVNSSNRYIQDASGYGIVIRSNSWDANAIQGKKITGTITGEWKVYEGQMQLDNSTFANMTFTTVDELPSAATVTAIDATNFASHPTALVKLESVTFASEEFSSRNVTINKGNASYTLRDGVYLFGQMVNSNYVQDYDLPLSSTTCDVTGLLIRFTKNNNTTYQLVPVKVDGIDTKGADAVLPTFDAGRTDVANPAQVATGKNIGFTLATGFDAVYKVNDGAETAITNNTVVTISNTENATKLYVKASRDFYDDSEVTYYYIANPALVDYSITCATGLTGGNVSADKASATPGTKITLTATPSDNYHFVSWSVNGGDIAVDGNNQFDMPAGDVTVSASFAEDDYATVTFLPGEATGGSAPSSIAKAYVGKTITMPGKGTLSLAGHTFAGWKLGNNTYPEGDNTYVITAADHTAGTISFTAQWESYPWAGNGKWELVTDASTLAANDYLVMACTSQSVVAGLTLNDSKRLEDVAATFSGTQATNLGADAAILKLGGTSSAWTLTNQNEVKLTCTAVKEVKWNNTTGTNTWTIAIDAENEYKATITNTGSGLGRFLYNSQSTYFTTYTSDPNNQMILPRLYRFVAGNYFTITYAKGTDDEVSNLPTAQVTESDGTKTLSNDKPICVGYTFLGWKDQDNNEYQPGDDVTLTKNVTLTAQWEEATAHSLSYDLNGGSIKSGTVPSSTIYYPDAAVTVTDAVLENGDLLFVGWTYKGETYSAGSSFTMPNENVIMTAKFANGAMYTITAKDAVAATGEPEGASISSTYSQTFATAKQATSGNSMTLTLSGYTGYTIKSVIMNMKSNGSSGTGTLSVSIGGNEVANQSNADRWFGSSFHTGSYTDINVSMNPTFVKSGQDIVISIAATENSLYCNSFTIEYEKSVEISGTDIAITDILPGTEIVVADGGVLNATDSRTLDNLTVEAGGKVTGSAALTVNNLTINSEAGKSGQIANADKVTASAVYMDVRFYSKNNATALSADEANVWYSISAPFDVNLNGGFIDIASGNPMVFGQDFDLFEYDGSKRATTGVTGWKRAQGKMKAGVACLIGFNAAQPTTIRLKAASNTLTNPTTIDLQPYGDAEQDNANANWNGVANPTMHYTTLDKDAQYFDNNTRGWETCTPSANSFVVGTAFFVHSDVDITLSNDINGTLRAPKRYEEENRYEFGVRITSTTDKYSTNNMFVRATEEAEASYQAGHDLQTLNGETAACALIYAKNYGMRLAIEEAPIVNCTASYEIGLYAPANGEYRIEANDTYDNADLYLTYEGSIIWNLSMGAYEIDLNKGTTNGYGLLLQAKVPQVVTGVDEVDAETGVQKIIIDEHVFILRGGQMYDVTGKMVK